MKTERKGYQKAVLVIAVFTILAGALYATDNFRKIPQNKSGSSILKRNEHGQGEKNQKLVAKTKDQKAKITVEIQEQSYTQEELQRVFDTAGKKLETLILGENKSLDEVRYDLNLVKTVPDTGIEVSWELSDYQTVNILGELQDKNLSEEGRIIELKALLTYGDAKAEHQFSARVFPPKLDDSGQFQRQLEKKMKKQMRQTVNPGMWCFRMKLKENNILALCKRYEKCGNLCTGDCGSGLMLVLEKQNEIQKKKARRHQLAMDYPEFISTFTLYLGAGMPARRAWFQIASVYRQQENTRCVYEEMVYTMREMQRGTPESECYEHFGMRCGLPVYRKFAVMLSQNLRKGTKGLAELLQREAAGAFEERKAAARKLGEETSTRLLGPMFLMLGVVLMIIVVPAFLRFRFKKKGRGRYVEKIYREHERTGADVCGRNAGRNRLSVVEMILILVVIIALVLIFKTQLTTLVNDIFEKITSESAGI